MFFTGADLHSRSLLFYFIFLFIFYFFAGVIGTPEMLTVEQAAGQMDPVKSKGSFVLDALSCLHSRGEKRTMPQPRRTGTCLLSLCV